MDEKVVCEIYEISEVIKKENLKKLNKQKLLSELHEILIKKHENQDIIFIKEKFNSLLYKGVKSFLKNRNNEVFDKSGEMRNFSATFNFSFLIKVHNYTPFYGQELIKNTINEITKKNNHTHPRLHLRSEGSKITIFLFGMCRKFFNLPPITTVKISYIFDLDQNFMGKLLEQGQNLFQRLELEKEINNKDSKKLNIL